MSGSQEQQRKQQYHSNYQGQVGAAPRAAYELHRSSDAVMENNDDASSSMADQSSSEAYMDIHTATGKSDSATVVTAAHINHHGGGGGDSDHNADASAAVHEMHLALLYLLSNPEEFERAVHHVSSNTGDAAAAATTLAQWNAEYGDNESLYTDADSVQQQSPQRNNNNSSNNNNNDTTTNTNNSNSNRANPGAGCNETRDGSNNNTPLPYAVFCDDAEVVLPQAHTASQLFGMETVTGMELEAAAGVPAISQLFLRWLALMPSGDHLNLIDPPGLTVMRIAGGRYRVTAAHRVVWTWMNEFAPVVQSGAPDAQAAPGGVHTLQIGDLVSMTIVDVFESDNQGKLLSYCPTFDNRAVIKTDRTTHAIRKKTGALKSALKTAQNSKLALAVAKYTGSLAQQLQQRVSDAVHNYNNQGGSPSRNSSNAKEPSIDDYDYDDDDDDDPATGTATTHTRTASRLQSETTSMYMGDDDMERHEV